MRRLVADVGQALLVTGAWDRFGTRKAYVSALHLTSRLDITLEEYKARLVEAHRMGLLQLARVDLVAAGDSRAIAESEIVVDGGAATYHAVLDPSATDEWAAAW